MRMGVNESRETTRFIDYYQYTVKQAESMEAMTSSAIKWTKSLVDCQASKFEQDQIQQEYARVDESD